jgi:hypothetical protein
VFLDEESSTLKDFVKIAFSSNHTDICKFKGPDDPRYAMVVDVISGFLKFAVTRELWRTISDRNVGAARKTIELGADVNALDYEGQNALHQVVRFKDVQVRMIELLLSNGADINARNGSNETALLIAEMRKKEEISRLLQKQGAQLMPADMRRINHRKASVFKKAGDKPPLDRIYMDQPDLSLVQERKLEHSSALDYSDSDCLYATRKSTMSITHFVKSENGRSEHFRLKTNIFDALYAVGLSDDILEHALDKYQEEHEIEKKEKLFTWYHIPANNVGIPFHFLRRGLLANRDLDGVGRGKRKLNWQEFN